MKITKLKIEISLKILKIVCSNKTNIITISKKAKMKIYQIMEDNHK
jgi:hypothetical protein